MNQRLQLSLLTRNLPLTILLILNAFFLRFNAFRGFNFFDMSAFLDAAWRIYIGQKPYADFIYFAGPVHLYVHALSFILFGFGKTAIWMHLVIVHSIVIISTFYFAKKFVPLAIAFLATLLSTTCFYWPLSHPWYDQTAHLWGMVALSVIVCQSPFSETNRAFRVGLFSGIMSSLSLMSKTNVGGLYIIVLIFLLCLESNRKASLKGFLLGAIGMAAAILILMGAPLKFIEQTILNFNTPFQKLLRFNALRLVSFWLMDAYWSATVLAMINAAFAFKQSWKTLCLQLSIFFASKLATATGTMLPTANIPLLGMQMASVFAVLYQVRKTCAGHTAKIVNTVSIYASIILTIALIGISAMRGFQLEAWRYNDLDPIGDYVLQSKPFDGWRTDRETGEAVDALVLAINSYVPKKDSILILTDIQIIYALTQRESFKGMPFIFTYKASPPPGKLLEETRDQILNHPPDWIITHIDQKPLSGVRMLIPYLRLEDFVLNSYMPMLVKNNYILLKKKAGI